MKFKNVLITLLMCSTIFIQACSSKPSPTEEKQKTQITNIPSWVLMPTVPNGIASAQCVTWSGNMSIDKAEASALGRSDLAKQLETKVKVLEKTYLSATTAQGKKTVAGNFESASRQISKVSLRGSRVEKVEIVEISGESKLCVLMVLSKSSQSIFDDLLKATGTELTPETKEEMKTKFLAKQAQSELQGEFKNN